MPKAKPVLLIPAVGYLRKSTKGKKADGRKKQEKSLIQQRTEIIKLAKGRFEILKWFEDEGISGWKRGAKRPDFQRMINEVKDLGAQAILCDNLDRFSRATYDDVQEDASQLRKAGVRLIVTASHSEYNLGHRNDIAEIIKFAAAVWAAHEFVKQLSRRVSLARRDAAAEGKRPWGEYPYGYTTDGKGGLTLGDAEHVKWVRWIFDQYGNRNRNLHEIAKDLTARKVPNPSGGQTWWVKTISYLLRRRCYRGDLVYNRKGFGQFFRIDADGEVVDAAEMNGKPGKVYIKEGAYQPIIDPALFGKVQARLQQRQTRSQRVLKGYALTGVLLCDHCESGVHRKAEGSGRNAKGKFYPNGSMGYPMHGARQKRAKGYSPTFYRCGSYSEQGSDCQRQIREDLILPFIMKVLGEEIADRQKLLEILPNLPDEIAEPRKGRAGQRDRMQRERDKLVKRIEEARKALYEVSPRTRQEIDRDLEKMRDEKDKLEKELAESAQDGTKVLMVNGKPITVTDYNKAEAEAWQEWWSRFKARAISMPVKGKGYEAYVSLGPMLSGLNQDPFEEGPALLVEPLAVNELLRELGCKVWLRWKTVTEPTKAGGTRTRHVFKGGRFTLGHRKGRVRYVRGSVACYESLDLTADRVFTGEDLKAS